MATPLLATERDVPQYYSPSYCYGLGARLNWESGDHGPTAQTMVF